MSSPSRSTSEPDLNVDTPLTERSVLFDDLSIDASLQRTLFGIDQHILVVGGLGFIGSHTVWELLKEGYNVIVVDNLSNAFRQVFETLEQMADDFFKFKASRPSLQFFEGDYRDVPSMRLILDRYAWPVQDSLIDVHSSTSEISEQFGGHTRPRISGVINLAGSKAVAESISKPLKYYANNISGLIAFCSLLDEYGIKRLIFSSSATVYGEVANKSSPLREEDCVHSRTTFLNASGVEEITQAGCTGLTNPYGRTKWMAEAILNDIVASDPDWTIFALRYFNPIGCDAGGRLGEDPKGAAPSNLMPVVVRVLTGESPVLDVFGTDWNTPDGTAIRDFIHVTDLARGHIAALAATFRCEYGGCFRTFNLGSGTGHSVLEVATAMEKASGRSVPLREMERRHGDVGSCVADPSRALQELNWTTEKTLDDCCEDTCRYLGIGKDSKESRPSLIEYNCPASLEELVKDSIVNVEVVEIPAY